MKRTIIIALTLVFALIGSTSLWAAKGAGAGFAAKDGSMLTVDLTNTITISGVVVDEGVSGSGMSIDTGDAEFTTVYGMGSQGYWNSLGIVKPAIGEAVAIDAVEVTFTDGSTRLIAVSLTVGDSFITLRTADGPAWRGAGSGACATCPNGGTCPLTVE